jgi:hypothetical protein
MTGRHVRGSDLAESLGASRVVPLGRISRGGVTGLLQLQQLVKERLRSTGGRPTDPDWAVQRQVRFKEETWEQLKALATLMAESGPKVGPAQVASLLIEGALADLGEGAKSTEEPPVQKQVRTQSMQDC